MNERIDIKVYKNNKFFSNSFAILKYEGHFEVIESIYKKQCYTIEVIK